VSIMNRDFVREMSRRTFLGRGAAGLGMVALNSLLNPRLSAAGQAANDRSARVMLRRPATSTEWQLTAATLPT